MLLVFMISITPKLYFHHALSHHEDELFASSADEQLTTRHNNCGFVNVVAVTPFITTASGSVWHSIKVFPVFNEEVPTFYKRVPVLCHTLRGPPVA